MDRVRFVIGKGRLIGRYIEEKDRFVGRYESFKHTANIYFYLDSYNRHEGSE
jgi:hypothetical protein